MRPETDRPPLIFERLERELEDLRDRSLYRTLENRGLDFCSNDYLGLATDPGFVESVADRIRSSIRAEGRVASTGSRLLSGHGPH
jgi:8-amino-7-oxononanoate synthase